MGSCISQRKENDFLCGHEREILRKEIERARTGEQVREKSLRLKRERERRKSQTDRLSEKPTGWEREEGRKGSERASGVARGPDRETSR